MNYLFFASLCFLTFVSVSCQSNRSGPPALTHQQYTYTGATHCDTARNDGVDVSVSYILLADSSAEARRINDTLRALTAGSIANWLDSAVVASHPAARTSVDSAASVFAASYKAMRKDMNNLGGCWELKTTTDTLHASSKTLTVRVDNFAYTGGAHPNHNLSFYNFDRHTGRLLALTDIVGDTTALLGMVEKAFRRQQKLLPAAKLDEEGYFLQDGHFFLPANVGIAQEGLLFYYNPYEIAAYAVGPIQIMVPYTQLRSILHDDWF